MTFPREFERHFFRDFDRRFAIVWWISLIVLYALAYYLQGLPPKELSEEDIVRFQEVIYRVTPSPTRVEKAAEGKAKKEAAVEEKPVEETAAEEAEKPVTEVKKVEKRQREKVDRRVKRESKRRKATAARKKFLAAATTVGGRPRAGSGLRAAASKVGVKTGTLRGADVGKMTGFVAGAKAGQELKKVERAGGVITEDVSGDVEIVAFEDLTPADQELMFKEAPLTLNENAITSKSRTGKKSAKRSRAAISKVVMKNKMQIQYCYWTYKKRDSSLKGRVVVEFTIDYTGKVKRVKFVRRQCNWYGNKLGVEVQRCIENVIKSWHFDPIDRTEGSFTAGATYIFE